VQRLVAIAGRSARPRVTCTVLRRRFSGTARSPAAWRPPATGEGYNIGGAAGPCAEHVADFASGPSQGFLM
jgi:hypothetical protein